MDHPRNRSELKSHELFRNSRRTQDKARADRPNPILPNPVTLRTRVAICWARNFEPELSFSPLSFLT